MSDKWGDQSTFTLAEFYEECEGLPAGWSIELVVHNDDDPNDEEALPCSS